MKLKREKLFALFLAMILAFTLVPMTAFAAALPCGHDSADAGDHSEAACDVPGHYNCDGKTHGDECWLTYFGGGDIPDTPPPDPPPDPPVPEGKEPPTEPPIEIEVDPDLDADIKLEEERIKELAKQTSWTISFKNKTDRAAEKNNPQWFDVTYTITLTATKQGGEDMYGTYNAKGPMKGVIDGTRYQMWGLQMASGGAMIDVLEMSGEGPLENFTFTLQKPSSPVDDDYFQTTYGTDLAPLVRESCVGAAQNIPVVWPGQYQMNTHVQDTY